MAEIIKKCDKKYFEDILSNKKNFEIRLADFEVREGDTLVLKEVFESKETGRILRKKIKYFLKTKELPFFSKKK